MFSPSADMQHHLRSFDDQPVATTRAALFEAFQATLKAGAPGLSVSSRYALAVNFMRRMPALPLPGDGEAGRG